MRTSAAAAGSASARPRLITAKYVVPAVACGVFLLYALTFLYFFVDDEAIPYVYARNLVQGHGLVYSPDVDGRVEGFSDLLHVLVAAVIYSITRLAHLPLLSVFAVGKAVSLTCGVGTVVVAWKLLVRAGVTAAAPTAAALLSLALAGPLAVWSCSSLEEVPFALGFALLWLALLDENVHTRFAAVVAVLLVLDRSDGFVWVFTVAVGLAVLGSPEQRRIALRYVFVPALVAVSAVEVFRFVYYRDWLPLPVFAKVAFKIQNNGQLVHKVPDVGYLRRFTQVYGWIPAGSLVIAAALTLKRRDARVLAVALTLLAVYVNIVGDWMFGFRFVVPLIAPAVVLLGLGVDVIRQRSRLLAIASAVALVLASAAGANRFLSTFLNQPNEVPRENFWTTRSFEARRFFGPYYELIETLRPLAPPGTLIAYNQAGLIPYALDLTNVDDLGICSRFYAELPATDVAYTEVGRYEPLTNDPVVSVRRAYLLNRNVRFIVGRTDLLRRANLEGLPQELFGGYYRLRAMDETRQNAVYERTNRSSDEYRRHPGLFMQSLTHVSRLQTASINGTPVVPSAMLHELPYLMEDGSILRVTGRFALAVRYATRDVDSRQFYIEKIQPSQPVELHVALLSASGHMVYEFSESIGRGMRLINKRFDAPVYASSMVLVIDGPDSERLRVFLHDVRLMGQTPELRKFVSRQVRFTTQ